jgi:serine/threonine protein kinase
MLTSGDVSRESVKSARVEVATEDDVVLVQVSGLIDEHFGGFGQLGEPRVAILDVSALTRMTSFGVRQWLKAKDELPRSISELYLLGCPTFFVDQLNMVLNFGGAARVITVVAPYTCVSCGTESGEVVDVLGHRALLAKGAAPELQCSRCGGKLELDETPESYFSFVAGSAATTVDPAAAQVLALHQLYYAVDTSAAEKPLRIIKLVHGSVTYFRIIGTIGSMFRARPFLVGAEGEVVIDLAETSGFDASGLPEWRRLVRSLTGQVSAVTLVDVGAAMLELAGDTFASTRNLFVWSVLVPYRCMDCGRTSNESHALAGATWPLHLPARVCSTCGGTSANTATPNALEPLRRAVTTTSAASAQLIARRGEVLSRAVTDANVAQAGDLATPSLSADDTILGKYKIVRRLSEGGMAEVFLAKQIGIGGFEKPVALKRIQSKLLESRHLAIDMFLNEAKIAGRLMHPNIVQVLDVGEVGGALYLAMEYVHGRDLRDVVKKLRASRISMPLGEACYIVREVAQALHHAYWSKDLAGNRLNVVHRDVSPHNVILGFDGSVKLLDFGVAMSAVTQSDDAMIVGKWQYMSPEHTTKKPLDHRSDLFSLGVVLYLLCCGDLPFSGHNPKEIVRHIRAGRYTPLRTPHVPEALAALVASMLSPDPAARPQTGLAVVAALGEITRSLRIDCSAAEIVTLLRTLFPDQRGEQAPVLELARISQPEITSPTPRSGPVAAVDVSVSLSAQRESAPTPSSPMVLAATIAGHRKLAQPTPSPPQPRSGWPVIAKGLLLAALLAALGIASYLFARPGS